MKKIINVKLIVLLFISMSFLSHAQVDGYQDGKYYNTDRYKYSSNIVITNESLTYSFRENNTDKKTTYKKHKSIANLYVDNSNQKILLLPNEKIILSYSSANSIDVLGTDKKVIKNTNPEDYIAIAKKKEKELKDANHYDKYIGQYNEYIKKGDDYVKSGNFSGAKSKYGVALKIMPSKADEVNKKIKQANDLQAKKKEDDKENTIEKRKTDRDARELPKAKAHDSSLEAQILKNLKTFENRKVIKFGIGAGGGQWVKVVKINDVILNGDTWTIKRHEFTGIILRKERSFYMVATNEDGDCFYQKFIAYKEYNGSGYGSVKTNSDGLVKYLNCDKIK